MAARSGRRRRRTLGYRFRPRVEVLEERRMLAVVLVTSELDTIDFADGVTSLREAVFATNIVAGADTIEFDASLAGKTILLKQGALSISDGLTINGLGAGLLSIDASGSDPTPDENNGDGSRIFAVNHPWSPDDFDVAIHGLCLTGGDAAGSGGAIFSNGNVRISDCVIENNASRSSGGGLYAGARYGETEIIVEDCIIRNNLASAIRSRGGGVALLSEDGGNLVLRNCEIYDNYAFGGSDTLPGGWAWGGGAYVESDGEAQILNNRIFSNRAEGTWAWGGGLSVEANAATVIISGNVFAENECWAAWTAGGGINVEAGYSDIRIADNMLAANYISGNSASGGGLMLKLGYADSTIVVERNQIRGNEAAEGGGIGVGYRYDITSEVSLVENQVDHNTARAHGGGLHIDGWDLGLATTIRQCSFTNNTAGHDGGGLFISSEVHITDSTISENQAGSRGGGIASFRTLEVRRSTISGNTAGSVGGFYGNKIDVEGSIIAGNSDSAGSQDLTYHSYMVIYHPEVTPEELGVKYDVRYSLVGTNRGIENILSEAPVGSPDANGNLVGGAQNGVIDPRLTPVGNNGGSTATQSPLPDSPVINAGDAAMLPGTGDTPAFDQRGEPYGRVVNGRIDMGAVEHQIRVPALAGDFNRDGRVDSCDYSVWRKSFGNIVAAYEGADGSGNGIVGPEDYGVWRAHFGETVAAVASAPAVSNLVRAAAVVAAEGIVTRPQATGDWVGLDDDVTTVDRGRKLSATREAIREVISERLGERLLSAATLVRGLRVKDGDIAPRRTQGEAGGNDVEMVDCAIAELSGWELKAARRRLFSEKPHKWGWN